MIQNKAEKIEFLPINEIIPHPKNPNKHPQEQVEHLVKQYKFQGFRNPLVLSNQSGFLICGHGRLEAAKLAGLESLPVIKQDFENEAQEYAYMTADNTVGTWATLDLAQINLDLDSFDLDTSMLGFQNFTNSFSFENKETEKKFNPSDEWVGMPEYDNEDKNSYRHVIVHFENETDCSNFFDCIKQNDTGETKSIWFPPQEKMDTEAKRYAEE